ncbi:phosphonate ABC transporter ATP-binding protein [Uliginosibacterium aquaticum]|uniref:ATP-binding cassette domain-containing protein n=1 Tax=Uliginosibacterium aquaticum TaxID=2731212 RepID=A0ABX2IMX9_9RHOO|nr:ATP-binding cassette domain-containing protein [Uliginosibacterium aquaticum]NSL55643.1 ATP-binding cassette domain-containing protein [Uliginosibacterium aquaticum]
MELALENLQLAFAGGGAALHGIDLSVAAGEQLALIGPSGAGKTSLLRCAGTALRPTAGQLRLDAMEPWALGEGARQHLRSRIGLIHQAPPLPPRQRVVTAVLAGRLGRWPLWRALLSLLWPQDLPVAQAALARMEVADKLFARCDQLSGGQLQRVGIARVLCQQADLLLADEPVSALDPALARHVLETLCAEARSRGATLLVSLHAVELALACFPRIVGLREGRVLFDKPAAEVSAQDLAELYAAERQPA